MRLLSLEEAKELREDAELNHIEKLIKEIKQKETTKQVSDFVANLQE